MSIDEFARTTPVRPPIVNRNTNPSAHRQAALYVIRVPYVVASHLKILIPVGTAIIIVADVKYARVSTSIPTVNMWCAHTTNPSNPIAIMGGRSLDWVHLSQTQHPSIMKFLVF
jgi:hypothetical protein